MLKSSFFHAFFIFFIILIIFSFSSTILFISSNNEITVLDGNIIVPSDLIISFSNSKFLWPTPGFKTITSPFGYRNAPTAGASSYHLGIDIGAPERYKHFVSFFWNSYLYWF